MKLFKKVADAIIKMMIPFAILALMFGLAKIFLDLRGIFQSRSITWGFNLLVTNILSMFIIIELLRSIIEYFEIHRVRITFIIDGALVFILREMMIGIYEHKIEAFEMVSLAFLFLSIGIIRMLAIVFPPKPNKDE
ncbi:MAG: phosphate-starvation-inducible PsiE family protein [Syntrophaceae bacterium]|nr:phosphate-starvation-inducible PsiE family protein [Syntrophaceae bacterium]